MFWLLYLVVVLFGFACLTYLDLPQIALHYDRSYLTCLLLGLYLIAEALSGRQAWLLSSENRIADRAIRWLSRNKLTKTTIRRNGSVVLHSIGPINVVVTVGDR